MKNSIEIQDVSKMYVLKHASSGQHKSLNDITPLSTTSEEFWALKDVSFNVAQGDVVGVIGGNGAGKSTLLKILSRITEPTTGHIHIYGRLASLLEVGTGFHPELTGRENIYLNGAILGLRRTQIEQMFDEIVDFAGVEQFLDTPVKRYSSGMYVRLAFAVAAHLTSDIMIIDEVLAVGDYAFQKKCMGKIGSVATEQGRTVLFVSHNMAAVKGLCKNVVWLSKGRVHMIGPSDRVVDEYLRSATEVAIGALDLSGFQRPSYCSGAIKINSIDFNHGAPLCHGEPLHVSLILDVLSEAHGVSVGFGLNSMDGTRLISFDSDLLTERVDLQPGKEVRVDIQVDKLHLQPGRYLLDVGARSGENHALDYIGGCYQVDVIPGPQTPAVIIRDGGGVRYPAEWHWSNHRFL
jgi:lipopolysaccharide transport system ATP-binding protein